MTPLQRMALIGVAGCATVVSVFLADILAISLPLLIIYLTALTAVCTYYGGRYPVYYYSLLIVNGAAIVAAGFSFSFHENGAWLELFTVVIFSLLVTQVLMLPGFIRRKEAQLINKSIHSLAKLNREIFSCFLQPEYSSHVYLFEKRLHVQKRTVLKLLVSLRAAQSVSSKCGLLRPAKGAGLAMTARVVKLNELFELMMDMALLRVRVSDHTVFSLCGNELSAILNEMNYIFNNKMTTSNQLLEKIKLLEDNYHHVIKVAAREPLAFLLFIASLKAFNEVVVAYE